MSAASPSPRTSRSSAGKDLIRGAGIEVAGGLVGQQQAGAVGQRPAERHPLLLAPRHRRRAVMARVGDAHLAQQFLRPRLGLAARHAIGKLRQHHVFQRREFRQQVVELVDEPIPRRRSAVRRRSPSPVISSPPISTLPCRPCRAARDVQQRRLARARGGHQRHHLARANLQVHALKHADLAHAPAVVFLLHALEAQHRLTHSAAPPPGSSAPPAAPGRS